MFTSPSHAPIAFPFAPSWSPLPVFASVAVTPICACPINAIPMTTISCCGYQPSYHRSLSSVTFYQFILVAFFLFRLRSHDAAVCAQHAFPRFHITATLFAFFPLWLYNYSRPPTPLIVTCLSRVVLYHDPKDFDFPFRIGKKKLAA